MIEVVIVVDFGKKLAGVINPEIVFIKSYSSVTLGN